MGVDCTCRRPFQDRHTKYQVVMGQTPKDDVRAGVLLLTQRMKGRFDAGAGPLQSGGEGGGLS